MVKRMLAVWVLAMTSVGTAWAEQCAPGIDCTPYGVGGQQFEVTVPGFETPLQDQGQRTNDGYVLQAKPFWRAGCFALTGWFAVGHADGFGELIPVIHGKWQGTVYPNDPQDSGIVSVRVEVKRNGAVSTTWDTYSTAELISKRLVYNQPDGGKIYIGDYNNDVSMTSPYLLSFQVKEDDEIRVKVCDLVGNASLTVHSLVLRTIPLEQ